MRGVIPPGAVVPIHSHDDAEAFYILAGTEQVLTQGTDGLEWNDARAGDYIDVPPGTPHAHRMSLPIQPSTCSSRRRAWDDSFNTSASPPRTLQPPSAEDVAHFIATSVRSGSTLGTPEENKAPGIDLPKF